MSLSKEDCDGYFIAFKTMRRKGRSRTIEGEGRKFPSLLARVILLMASVDCVRVQSERTFLFDYLTGQTLSHRVRVCRRMERATNQCDCVIRGCGE